MLRELVTRSPLLGVPLGVLLLFFSVFAIALLRTYGRRASSFDDVARLPLADDADPAQPGGAPHGGIADMNQEPTDE